jgi:type I restriction enzyme S subunit
MSDLTFAPVADVATLVMGQSPAGDSCASHPVGVALLNGPTEFGVTHPIPAQWTTAPARFAHPGDLLFCVRGSTTGRMNRADQEYAIGRGLAAIRGDTSRDTDFLHYAMRVTLPALLTRTSGSVFPNLSSADMRSHQLPWPNPEVRWAIAEVLGALDDKIENNRAVAGRCDELWQAHFAANIVDAGSEEPLSSLASFVNGRAFTKDATGTGRMVVRIAELNSGPAGSTVYNDIAVPDEHLVRAGDLLFAWSGSLTVHRWFRPEAIINQHIFKVVSRPDVPPWLMHGCLLQLLPWFRGIAADKATTMGHIQRRHLDANVTVPAHERLTQLDTVCAPLWTRALQAEREVLILTELRDALLPKLTSGQIRVRDAQRLVESAS